MSAIQKLLHIGMSALLIVGLGCKYEAALSVSLDSVRHDKIGLSNVKLIGARPPSPLITALTTPNARIQSTYATTLQSITPSFGADIFQKRRENADVVGWLQVPGTTIDTQIVQNPERNNPFPVKNNYYLNTDFYGTPDKNGTYSADYRASLRAGRDGLSRITALYAHSWDDNPDGILFSQLKKYRDPDFAREHPYIFFSTESDDMAWEVFAVFDTTIYLPYVRPNLPLEKFYQTLDTIHNLSYYNYDLSVSDSDQILVLSTCTFSVDGHPVLPELNDYRFVIMAKLVDPSEEAKDSAVFAVNENRLLPDETRKLRNL